MNIKKILTAILVAALFLSLAACAPQSGQAPASASASASAPASAEANAAAYRSITPEDVKKMLDGNEPFVLVDVRSTGEFDASHIKGAVSVPVETIVGGKPAGLDDLNAKIVVYCETGARSRVAAEELTELGYTNVYDMGGLDKWTYGIIYNEPAPTDPEAATGVLSKFGAMDIDGRFVNEAVWSGYKLTMVNVWATFCGPCINEMPDLGKLSAEYQDKDFQIVGIVADSSDNTGEPIDDMVSLAKDIVKQTGADYKHILASSDLNTLLLNSVSAVPTTIFVDEKGSQVGEAYVGSRSEDEWKTIIDELLKEVE
jgi:rhodanese-related sulfurtransferase/thiol-disulfide isomerase/thioredoxin